MPTSHINICMCSLSTMSRVGTLQAVKWLNIGFGQSSNDIILFKFNVLLTLPHWSECSSLKWTHSMKTYDLLKDETTLEEMTQYFLFIVTVTFPFSANPWNVITGVNYPNWIKVQWPEMYVIDHHSYVCVNMADSLIPVLIDGHKNTKQCTVSM